MNARRCEERLPCVDVVSLCNIASHDGHMITLQGHVMLHVASSKQSSKLAVLCR